MRIPGTGRLAVLGLGFLVSVADAQSEPTKFKPKPTEETSGWWKSWFGAKDTPKVSTAPPVGGPTVADKHTELDRLMKAYLRRQEVCDRLRDIALQNSDDKLYEEAGRLDELAWRLHQTQSNRLLGMPALTAAKEEPPEQAEESTADLLKRAASGGSTLPPRLRNGSKIEPATANRGDRRREDER